MFIPCPPLRRWTELGKKRLVSGPARKVGSITADGGKPWYRPAVGAPCDDVYATADALSDAWMMFMFQTLDESGKRPVDLVSALRASRYPELTIDEATHSAALQVLALYVHDLVVYHVLAAAPVDFWEVKAHIFQKYHAV